VDTHPWYRRVLPVTALAVGLFALLALAFPGVRQQVALSASHQPQEYVALSFARDPAGTVPVCTGSGADLSVRFTVDSELGEVRTVEYVVSVGDVDRTGTMAVEPGESVDITQVVKRPRGRFPVSVSLPDVDRRILAHCQGTPR